LSTVASFFIFLIGQDQGPIELASRLAEQPPSEQADTSSILTSLIYSLSLDSSYILFASSRSALKYFIRQIFISPTVICLSAENVPVTCSTSYKRTSPMTASNHNEACPNASHLSTRGHSQQRDVEVPKKRTQLVLLGQPTCSYSFGLQYGTRHKGARYPP